MSKAPPTAYDESGISICGSSSKVPIQWLPDALIAWFGEHGVAMEQIGLDAVARLHAGMTKAGPAVELIETRHVRAAFKTMPVETDKKDARGITQMMRLGWFRAVHCKSLPAQEVRALLTARRFIQGKLHDIEMSLRGILRGFGLKVGPTTRRTYAARIRELIEGHPTLEAIAASLLPDTDQRYRRTGIMEG
ncbi:hypothetical protein QA644_34950 (plasmid) [Rhizobium sp. CC1099]|uniref:hypothetical protein n=1 Tax=Rhizobium sp. CC1099 TaxID=3039160 RepID=UPI0024B20825|nr:hypothetical protein [Rhizobium sp. CC1099]WFU92085.1 hypothetical protein QA644_34950 [Rhizobium sp. CC1099]